MAGARDVKRRIKSVENTRQITRTMELVATSKLKRATDRVGAARPYADALDGHRAEPVRARSGGTLPAPSAARAPSAGGGVAA